MTDNPGAVVMAVFIAVLVLGGLATVLGGGDITSFNSTAAKLAVPVAFIALGATAVATLKP